MKPKMRFEPIIIGLILVLSFWLWVVGAFGADQNIYLDNAGAGAGSIGDPYGTFAEINWSTGGANSIFDWVAGGDDVYINLKRGAEWREQSTIGTSGVTDHPITLQYYGSGADPIINGAALVVTWTETAVGEEIITNGDCELDANWSDMGSPPIHVRSEEQKHGGLYSRKWTANSQVDGVYNTTFNATSGNTYRTAFWLYGDGTNAVCGRLKTNEALYYYDDMGWNVGYTPAVGWVYHTYDITVTETDAAGDFQIFADAGELAGTWYLDDVSIKQTVSNIWQAALTTEPNAVWFDEVLGTKVASVVLVNGAGKWYWASNVLYIYYTEDPDGAVVIEANIRYGFYLADKSYITIQNLHIEKAKLAGIRILDTAVQTDITIQDVDIYNSGLNSIHICQFGGTFIPDNLTIDGGTHYHHNRSLATSLASSIEVYHGDDEGGSGGGNNLTIKNLLIDSDFTGDDPSTMRNGMVIRGGDNVVIETNEITGVDHGIGLIGIDGNTAGTWLEAVTVRYNFIHGTTDDAIWFDGTRDADTYGYCNILDTNADNSIDVAGDVTLYGNTMRNSGKEMLVIRRIVSTVICKNNIFLNWNTAATTLRAIEVLNPALIGGITSDYNCFYHASDSNVAAVDGTDYTLAAWRVASSQDANSLNSDPLFTDAASDDFSLKEDSPCNNAGEDLGASYDDALRPESSWPDDVTTEDQDEWGSGWEIGAYVRMAPPSQTMGGM